MKIFRELFKFITVAAEILLRKQTIIIAKTFVMEVFAKKNRVRGENNLTLLDSRILTKYTQIRINRPVTAWRGAIEGSAD